MPHQLAHGYTSASGFLEELIQTPTWFADVVYFLWKPNRSWSPGAAVVPWRHGCLPGG
jgi:hypothetical protein